MTTPTKLASIPVLFNTDATTGTANTITGAALALSLPSVDGQVLSATTAGVTSWVPISSGSSLVFSGNGIGANTAAVLTWTYNGVASTGGDTNFTFTFAGTNKLPTTISFSQGNGQTDGRANFITQLAGNATVINNWSRTTPGQFQIILTELVPAGLANVTCTITQTGGTGPAFTYVFTPGIATTTPTRVNIGNNLLGAVTGTVLDLSATGSAGVPTLQQVTTAGAQTSVNTFFGAATGNSIGITGNVNGSAPILASVAATSGTPDANVNLFLNTVGRGALNLCAQQANYLSVSSSATGNPFISTAGSASSMNLLHSASGQVNIGPSAGGFVGIQGSNTGPALITATNANQSIGLMPTGTGATVLGNTQTQTGLTIAGNLTSSTQLQSTGSANDINLTLLPKGVGNVILGAGGNAINLGTNSFTTQLLAANAANSPSNFTAGAAGDALTSRGSGNTPFWSTPYTTGQIVLAAFTPPGISDQLINLGTLPNTLPSDWTYASGLFTNNSGRSRSVTVQGKVQGRTGATAPGECDLWVGFGPTTQPFANRPWQWTLTFLTANTTMNPNSGGAWASGSGSPWLNFSATFDVPSGQTFGLYMYGQNGAWAVGGTPAGGFGSGSTVQITIRP